MLEKLKDLPRGIEGLKAVGKITREDYDKVFEPILDDARREGRRIRFLYQLGAEFDGFTAGAAWEDAKIGFRSLRLFDGCAIVSDAGWIRESARLVGFMMPCPVRVFENQARDKAIEWLSTLPESAAISHRLVPESGVIVAEVKNALRAQDFDALAVTADTWIEAHGDLLGIVIHTREFPGWENLGSLMSHVRFIRDHHRKVKKIALAADSPLASLIPPSWLLRRSGRKCKGSRCPAVVVMKAAQHGNRDNVAGAVVVRRRVGDSLSDSLMRPSAVEIVGILSAHPRQMIRA